MKISTFLVVHTKSSVDTTYAVQAQSAICAIESVLDALYGFTRKDTVVGVCRAKGCTVTAMQPPRRPLRLFIVDRRTGAMKC